MEMVFLDVYKNPCLVKLMGHSAKKCASGQLFLGKSQTSSYSLLFIIVIDILVKPVNK